MIPYHIATSSQYEQKSVEFTTGNTEASGKVYIYIPSGESCDAYLDATGFKNKWDKNIN